MSCSRRQFLTIVGAVPFLHWSETHAVGQPVMTRFDVLSPDGQRMLKSYAKAVHLMGTTSETSPLSWLFQWYTHAVPDDAGKTKDSELNRVFGNSPSLERQLAQDMWWTCQAHLDEEDENAFLPWHRMYLFFFERIARKVSGDASFTLPYWNYSARDPQVHGILPEQFRMNDDPLFGALYRDDRNPGVNTGVAIDAHAPRDLDLNALRERWYAPRPPAVPGFCASIDSGLHGNVHVDTGNRRGMGRVPWAANDPIFWLHHCNIDRLWASWNQNGGQNPEGDWLTREFVFADENRKRVAAKVGNFDTIAKCGYAYDRLELPPPGQLTLSLERPPVIAASARDIILTPQTTTVPLQRPATAGPAPQSMSDQAKSLGDGRALFLVLRNLGASSSPGTTFQVFFGLPDGVTGADANNFRAGTINFFDAAIKNEHSRAPGGNKFFSFEITPIARRLQQAATAGGAARVTIMPSGAFAEAAYPTIGSIDVIEQ